MPFTEDDLWNGYPEESNAPYGLAKKMLIVLSDAYRRQYGFDSCVPVMANLYGPEDNFDLEDSHVIAAMVRKYVEAAERGEPEVVLWGTGEPSREFLYVDDAARALILAAERCDSSDRQHRHRRRDVIRDLAEIVAAPPASRARPSGTPRAPTASPTRYLDVSRAESASASAPRSRSTRD